MGNQTITFTLFGMSDGSSAGDIVVPMRVLVGDTNGNGVVNATDVSQVKSQVGKPLNASNARADVNANGAITASDVALVKSSVGRTLPPGHADTPKR
jgi:hypothetical protein